MQYILGFLKSPGEELIQFGPIIIRWYGLLIAISVLIGLNLSTKLARKRGLSQRFISDLLPVLIFSSIIGARIYYVIFEWGKYSGKNFWAYLNFDSLSIPIPSSLEIWRGGIAIHGALIAGTISVLIFCKIKKQSFWDALDVLFPSVALGQAIGRWGNFFNNEAFGVPTNLPWKLFIPFELRPDIFKDQSFFHPTFLYESCWNILVFFFLLFIFQMGIKGLIKIPSGALTFLYLIAYSAGRLWIEGLRIDPLCINAFPPFCEGGVRIAQFMSILLIWLGFLGMWWRYKKQFKQSFKRTNKISQ
tara:strand:- start:13816 stop:14724 length:909 start_codon:yes stop_codon:yes gene_type:complete